MAGMSFREPMTSANDREKVVCACKKSYCLKLYCDCFRKRLLCNEWCSCESCYNNGVYEEKRKEAVSLALQKNQNAFRATTSKGLRQVEEVGKGCNCLKSHCLKKYCECFQTKRLCDGRCRCLECKNQAGFLGVSGGRVSGASSSKALTSEGYQSLADSQGHFLTRDEKIAGPLDELISDSAVQQICMSLLNAVQPLRMQGSQLTRELHLPLFRALSVSLQGLLDSAPRGFKRMCDSDSDDGSQNSSHKQRRAAFL